MPNSNDHPTPSHEVTKWHSRPFAIGAACFFAFMIVMYAILAALTSSWTRHVWPPHGPERGPAATTYWSDDVPQLQENAEKDLRELRREDYQRLHTTAWTDASHTYATIPIEEAMTLLANGQASGTLNQLLPAPQPATPEQLQNQKAGAMSPTPTPPAPLK